MTSSTCRQKIMGIFSKTKSPSNHTYIRNLSISLTEEKIIQSPAPNLKFPKGNFAQFLLKNATKWQHKTALECSITGMKLTYSQLIDQSARWSGFLRSIGIEANDVVSFIAPNCPRFGPIFLGTAAIGATLSPLNHSFTAYEIRNMLDSSNSKVVVFSEHMEEVVENAVANISKSIQLFCIGSSKKGHRNVDDILDDKNIKFDTAKEIDGEEVLYMPFSSGTTGPPKAVALTHNAFISNVLQLTNPYHSLLQETSGSYQENMMGMLPFFHVYGSIVIFSAGLYKGAKIITLPKFNPELFLSTIINHKVGYLHTVPTLLHFLNSRQECSPQTMEHIHTTICGASPLVSSTVETFKDKLQKDIAFIEGYGMTETLITHLTPRGSGCIGTMGQLLSNTEAKIIDPETGRILQPNERGELCIRTPSMMLRYVNNSDATSDILRPDGWLHTGDIAFCDQDGYFSVIDRTKDLIKVKGLQISPTEIEAEIQKHPSVVEVSVIGVPDDRSGEVPKAFVVAKSKVDEAELNEFLAIRLAKHKQVAGGITFVKSLPKSDTGKVLRKILRTWADKN